MPSQNDTIKSCVVKIEDNGTFLQSGVLWMPSEESEVAYVLTVTHGINEYTPSNIRFWRGNMEVNLPVSKVLFHPDNVIDAAILIILNSGLQVSPYAFRFVGHADSPDNLQSVQTLIDSTDPSGQLFQLIANLKARISAEEAQRAIDIL